METLESHY